MRTLPRAVASTGPAITGRPQASAVSWQSRELRAPPPTRCTVVTVRPDRRGGSRVGGGGGRGGGFRGDPADTGPGRGGGGAGGGGSASGRGGVSPGGRERGWQ